MSEEVLEHRLRLVLEELDRAVHMVTVKAEAAGVSPYEMRTKDGQYLMAQLAVAQANALSALVTLMSR